MRTKILVRALALSVGCANGSLSAQITESDNHIVVNSSYVGCDATSTYPLQIRHDANYEIQWFTDATQRMQLNKSQNNTINGFTTLPTDGFLGLGTSPQANTAPGTPWTRLHLNEPAYGGVIQNGYRNWMRNGVTMTGHGDQMYVGHKYSSGEDDPTDAIFQWSDNGNNDHGPDLMRFVFTSAYSSMATDGSTSLFGQEIMQLHPEGFVGIGDWFAAAVSPEERLDVLDGHVRIRQLPTDASTDDDKVMVVDDDGVVHWRPMSDFGECDWLMTNEGTTGPHDLTTALGSSTTCPNEDDLVGIGVTPNDAKLQLYANTATTDVPPIGVYVHVESDGNDAVQGIGVRVEPDGASGYAQVGVLGDVYNATLLNIGVSGRAYVDSEITGYGNRGVNGSSEISSGTITDGVGVYAYANAGSGSAVTRNQAVYALASGSGGTTNYGLRADASGAATNYGVWSEAWGSGTKWAGWFQGDLMITGNGWVNVSNVITSDENLKTNIEDVENALATILQLNPKTYEFNTTQYPHMHLAEGPQIGLLAQEVEQVVPEVVASTTFPIQYDHEGNQVSEALPIKGIRYEELIPLLIGAIKEQEVVLEEQSERLDDLEEALSNCCSNMGGGEQRVTGTDGNLDVVSGNTRALTIQPNPFSEQTTVYYTLEHSGRMQLMANSADGKQLRVLHEAALEAGQYQHEWATSDLSPGIYYVTLLLDGEPIVKKAVKVTR